MNFCCLFPAFYNIHLTKDVASIPYYLSKDCDYNSTIITFDNEEYIDSYVLKEVKLKIIPKKFKINILNYFLIIFFLIKNANEIDVLNCYHTTIPTLVFFFIYKIFNKNGITFLKFDIRYEHAFLITGHGNNLKYSVISQCYIILFKFLIDLATVETKMTFELFFESNEIYKEKIMYMPIFINPNHSIGRKKKNQIISVSRIGTYPKASEIVLETFKNAIKQTKNNWTLKMVGEITEEFKGVIQKFLIDNPTLANSIIFTGYIGDRNELYEMYSESKIFLLPSRYESFGIVFPEALFYSNYLIITDVGIGKYLIQISDFGQIVEKDNVKDISEKLIDAMENYDEYLKNNPINHKQLISDEFGPKNFTKLLNLRFNELKKL